jgi:PAS domain S-box-containing protein
MTNTTDFKALFIALTDAYYAMTPDDKLIVLEVSDAFLRATDLTREQIVGKGLFEVFNDADDAETRSMMKQQIKRVLQTKVMEEVPRLRYTNHGEERFWRVQYIPVLDRQGAVSVLLLRCERLKGSERTKAE